MGVTTAFRKYQELVRKAEDLDSLDCALCRITQDVGCDYYAVSHHIDWGSGLPQAFRLINYPEPWIDFYDRNGFVGRDFVHRASGRTQNPFLWREAAELIEYSTYDERFLDLARRHGIYDGFTVPSNVPGEFLGSCTFATAPGHPLDEDGLILARLIAPEVFAAARRLVGLTEVMACINSPLLTARQRECLLWMMAGKTDWETGIILGIAEETVRRHISDAGKRLGAQSRPLLAFLACRSGVISYPEVPFGSYTRNRV
ncbi:LuxR family transcriptional regulator [Novosphingobium sp. KA1]|uniref:LuxR family transcriptional regulator n=1 Tax=Novosphingobium sp. (strain KA1) TaxID=164608 RepID=UPI001A8E7129|nr:LuxR family transcriptional regulator [Novosphingobium sp. KA1]